MISGCEYRREVEDYNYIPNNSMRFIRRNDDTSILINKDDIYYFLILGKKNIEIDVDYVIELDDIDNSMVINDIEFRVNDKVEIIFNNKKMCIYIKELDRDNYLGCDFIYLYNPDGNFYITLSSDILVMFYHTYTKFSYRFMEHMATVWIDTSTIDDSTYTTLTIEEDDFEVVKTKIRGKTIHKKVKT